MGGIGNEAPLSAEHFLNLRQHAVECRLHRFEFARQGRQVQRLERATVACPQGLCHVGQGLEAPANGHPDHRREHQATQYVRPQGVTHDAIHQIRAYVVALTDPDPQLILFVFEQEGAPVAVVQVHHIAEARRGGRGGEGGGADGVHQHLALAVPDLEGDFGFIGMAIDLWLRFAQGLVERLIQLGVLLAGQRHAHHALQHPGVLGQLSVIDLGNFMVAVMQVEHADHGETGEHQANDQRQGATPDRSHRRSSTK